MNLPFEISTDEVKELFEKHGTVSEVELPVKKG
jgi:hypothetical protein